MSESQNVNTRARQHVTLFPSNSRLCFQLDTLISESVLKYLSKHKMVQIMMMDFQNMCKTCLPPYFPHILWGEHTHVFTLTIGLFLTVFLLTKWRPNDALYSDDGSLDTFFELFPLHNYADYILFYRNFNMKHIIKYWQI